MKKKLIALALIALPSMAFAQATAFTILGTIGLFIKKAIPILVGAAILFLIFNIIRYVLAGDAEKKEDAKGYMIMSFVALAFFALVFGVISALASTFGLQKGTDIQTTGQGSNDFVPTIYY